MGNGRRSDQNCINICGKSLDFSNNYSTLFFPVNINFIVLSNYFIKINNFTMAPYERNLIDVKMLHEEEKNWINNYHNKVYQDLSKLINMVYMKK